MPAPPSPGSAQPRLLPPLRLLSPLRLLAPPSPRLLPPLRLCQLRPAPPSSGFSRRSAGRVLNSSAVQHNRRSRAAPNRNPACPQLRLARSFSSLQQCLLQFFRPWDVAYCGSHGIELQALVAGYGAFLHVEWPWCKHQQKTLGACIK